MKDDKNKHEAKLPASPAKATAEVKEVKEKVKEIGVLRELCQIFKSGNNFRYYTLCSTIC